jgi:chromosome segregation ATPase
MAKSRLLKTLLLGGLLAFASQVMAAQNGKNNNQKNDERRENEAVQKAQKDVSAAEKVVRDAEKSARQAADKLKGAFRDQSKAASQIQKRRDDLEEKHADLVGLTEARRSLDTTRQAYEKAGAPILKQVTESTRYRDAQDAAKQADRRLNALRGDEDLEDGERLKLMADAAKTKQLPAQLEREALDAEESLKDERTALRMAEQAVVKANAAMDKAVEKDPELKAAKDAFESAKDHFTAARRESLKEAKQLADARQKLSREQNDLQQKINADRKDDNKPKNKNKR